MPREYRTRKIGQNDPNIQSSDTPGSGTGYNRLSYLYGSVCANDGRGTGDLGADNSYPWANHATNEAWQAERKLRRHTIDQGSSTFVFPQKS